MLGMRMLGGVDRGKDLLLAKGPLTLTLSHKGERGELPPRPNPRGENGELPVTLSLNYKGENGKCPSP
jgi:hypothetical protein